MSLSTARRLMLLGALGRGYGATQTLTLQPDATDGQDVMILGGAGAAASENNNHGALTYMDVGLTGVDAYARGMLRFTGLSAIPATSWVTSAVLTLYCEAEYSTHDIPVGAYRAITQWYEGAKTGAPPDGGTDGSTWNLRNANGSVVWAGGAGGAADDDWHATASAKATITGVGAFTYNVVTDVKAFVSGAQTNYGWWLISDDEVNATRAKRFSSDNTATAAQRPKLVVTYREHL